MPIQWHHDNHQTVARQRVGAQPGGGLRVRAHGRGQCLFFVDHDPHYNNLLTTFAPGRPPVVQAFDRNGYPMGQVRVRHDRYGDRNACVWDTTGNPMTAYVEVYALAATPEFREDLSFWNWLCRQCEVYAQVKSKKVACFGIRDYGLRVGGADSSTKH